VVKPVFLIAFGGFRVMLQQDVDSLFCIIRLVQNEIDVGFKGQDNGVVRQDCKAPVALLKGC